MSPLVDTNILVYAATPTMDEHEAARHWLADRFADRDSFVALCWPVLYAFVRLVCNRRIMGEDAVSVKGAWQAAEQYRLQPTAVLVTPGSAHARLAAALFQTPGLGSDDVPDVQVAALALEHGLVLATRDHGFARFAGLNWMDPLQSQSNDRVEN